MKTTTTTTEQTQTEIEIINPTHKSLTKTYQKENRKGLIPYWDKEYINNGINKITNPQEKMLIKFLWFSGVRITEAINIKTKDIDFINYTIQLQWLKNRKYKYRILPVHPRLKEILEVYVSAMNQEQKLFPISRQRAWQITKKHLNGNPHKIRHSFAVNWLRSKGDIIILHRILGHSKIQTTMEYLKIVPTDLGKELIKIEFE
jgi:integrase/recombinase XerD